MIHITIHDKACRGCQLCLDICPTNVFTFDAAAAKATVAHEEDCIGCLSCSYLCPSGAFRHEEHRIVKNFYRDCEFLSRMEKFL
jgi:NAD-dependent dihydropyrimidine dehydrogenase PreA subunit